MIKVLHFADFHLGMENYGRLDPRSGVNSRIVDFLHRMDEMIAYAKARDVDLVIFAGDAFKNRQPNPTVQREFAYRIRELAELAPVVMITGNHDMPMIKERASSLEIYDTLAVPNVLVAHDYDVMAVDTKAGRVQIGLAPYPLKSGLLTDEETHGKTIGELGDMMQETLQLILRNLAMEAAKSNDPRLLIGHFTVSGVTFGSERDITIGMDTAALLSEVADPAWDYVAMGHIHKHQNMTKGRVGVPPVIYSGSMERITFNEEGDVKGFCWVELERGKTRWEFIPVAARQFVTIRADVRHDPEPMPKLLDLIAQHDLEGAIVRMVIQATPDYEPLLQESRLQEALREQGAYTVAGIQKDVERTVRSRLGTSPESMTKMELLRQYFRAKDTSPERIELLLSRAEDILKSE